MCFYNTTKNFWLKTLNDFKIGIAFLQADLYYWLVHSTIFLGGLKYAIFAAMFEFCLDCFVSPKKQLGVYSESRSIAVSSAMSPSNFDDLLAYMQWKYALQFERSQCIPLDVLLRILINRVQETNFIESLRIVQKYGWAVPFFLDISIDLIRYAKYLLRSTMLLPKYELIIIGNFIG